MNILDVLTSIIILSGVILIYDARIIAKKEFSFGNQNEATTGLKMLGFILAILGGIIFYIGM